MSSFGGPAAELGDRFEDGVDDRARGQLARALDDLEQARAVNSSPASFIASKTPSEQNTKTSPVASGSVTSS